MGRIKFDKNNKRIDVYEKSGSFGKENKFQKILFLNKYFASSLYKKLGTVYFDYLSNENIKKENYI